MLGKSPVVDADAHKIENPIVFFDYLDSRYHNRLRVAADTHGQQRIAITDCDPGTGKADFVRLYPQPEGMGKGAFSALHPETTLGALFNRVRIAHMDREGVDAQVLYGSLMLTFGSLIDRDLAAALCRAYNNYVHDDCKAYDGRLFPVGVLPLQDVSQAVDEMRRCVEDLGMVAVSIPPNLPVPHPDAGEHFPRIRTPVHLSDARFFRLYEAAEKLDVAIGIHGAPGLYLCGGSADQVDTFTLAHLFGQRDQQQMALAKLIMDGVLERFPKLRFGFLEGGCGWLPDFMHALVEHWEKRVRNFEPGVGFPSARFAWEMLRERGARASGLLGRVRNLLAIIESSPARTGDDVDHLYEHRSLKRSPEEYLARGQIFMSFGSDDPAPIQLKAAFGPVGEKLACWAGNYGQWNGPLAGCIRRVSENPEIGLDYAERLLARNAFRLYGRRLEERFAARMGSKRKGVESTALAASAALVSRR